MKPWLEERCGCLVGAGGLIWAVYHGTYQVNDIAQGFTAVYLKSGPLELTAIGILIWLHAKWRRATHINRA
jgi:hypothetical protein